MGKKDIEQYEHSDKQRVNNPPSGLVTPDSDPDTGEKQTYQYDPHLDPELQWTGKAEQTSFDVPTVSLHVHERIDPRTIIDSVRQTDDAQQQSLFADRLPLRDAVDFYKHKEGWSNRLIAGDSLLVMNSLLEKEGMGGAAQTIYIDPPYGIKYGSNFQPFVGNHDVTDGKDDSLTTEPEMIKAFRDTWELGIHSYLSYLRNRLLLARDLLNDSGSCFVQIGDENVHRVALVMDDIFGAENRVATISFVTTSSSSTARLPQVADYLLWYAKDKTKIKYRQLYELLKSRKDIIEFFSSYVGIEDADGICRTPTSEERADPDVYLSKVKLYQRLPLTSQGHSATGRSEPYEWDGRIFQCPTGRHWSVSTKGLDRLAELGRLVAQPGRTPLELKRYEDEIPGRRINNIWHRRMHVKNKNYVVETATDPIQRCILMTSDPGDLVLDITCGSGTTAYVAEQWGRRWITCDTSRVALHLAKQRLVTANFDYYKLAHPDEGVGSGFIYKETKKISASILGYDQPQQTDVIYDQPEKNNKKARVTGPFTVEAVPAPYVKSLDKLEDDHTSGAVHESPDNSIARSGETSHQSEWRDELLRTGVRAKDGNRIEFTRVEPMEGAKYIQAVAETKEKYSKKVLVVFGPKYAPLGPRRVEQACKEARLFEPDILLYCAFKFDEEAAKDIDEFPPIDKTQRLKVHMNDDLLTGDLRKKQRGNESFWLIGQPDVKIHAQKNGMSQVEVCGFDYYDPRTNRIDSGGPAKIAMWMLDTDYDGRSLYPSQVFFPMAGKEDNWGKLAKHLKAEIDQERIKAFAGTRSLEFKPGSVIAVKIIDDRGIESLRVIEMENDGTSS